MVQRATQHNIQQLDTPTDAQHRLAIIERSTCQRQLNLIAQRLDSPQIEICALYLAIAATLLLFGSGKVSVDLLFQLGRKKKDQPKRR